MTNACVTVLGVHDGHNSGAAVVRDGKVIVAISEERLNNIKNYSGPPLNSIRKVFEIAHVKPSEVNIIAIGSLVRTHALSIERPFYERVYDRIAPYVQFHASVKLLNRILHRFTVSLGEGFKMERIASSTYYNSLNNTLYSEITGYLGLKRWEHEYKVKGLAPFHRPRLKGGFPCQ
jgi:carbamoyltransferase